jgi:hypothetical protein
MPREIPRNQDSFSNVYTTPGKQKLSTQKITFKKSALTSTHACTPLTSDEPIWNHEKAHLQS